MDRGLPTVLASAKLRESSLSSSSISSDSMESPSPSCDVRLSILHGRIKAALLQHCISSCGQAGQFRTGFDELRQVRKKMVSQLRKELLRSGCAQQADEVMRILGLATSRAIAEAADRLNGRGWSVSQITEALNRLISPILIDLGVPDHDAILSISMPVLSVSAHSRPSFIVSQRSLPANHAWNQPELMRLLHPFDELLTLRWTLAGAAHLPDGLLRPELISQLGNLATRSCRLAAERFPSQLTDCLGSLALAGFVRLAGTPRSPRVSLCTSRYVADTLWPAYRQLLASLTSKHVAPWAGAALWQRLADADVCSMVATVQARLKLYAHSGDSADAKADATRQNGGDRRHRQSATPPTSTKRKLSPTSIRESATRPRINRLSPSQRPNLRPKTVQPARKSAATSRDSSDSDTDAGAFKVEDCWYAGAEGNRDDGDAVGDGAGNDSKARCDAKRIYF